MDIKEAKNRCNELVKVEHANWIGISNQEAIDVLLNELEKYEKQLDLDYVENELDKKDKEIKKLKQDIKEVMGKDRDCLTLGYHSAYVGLIDDLINIIEED